mgnify:CR=1 FL=1
MFKYVEQDKKDGHEILHKVSDALDPRKFTLKVLESVVMAYEDDHPGNITANPVVVDEEGTQTYELCGIDSDHALLELLREEGLVRKRKVLNQRSVAYCFPQMQEPMNLPAIKEFLALNIHFIALLAKEITSSYEHITVDNLFSREQIVTYYLGKGFGQTKDQPCLIPTEIPKSGLANLYLHFQGIRETLSKVRKDTSPLNLVKAVVPCVATPCGRVLDVKEIDPTLRYEMLTLNALPEDLKGNRKKVPRSTVIEVLNRSMSKPLRQSSLKYLRTQKTSDKTNEWTRCLKEDIFPSYHEFGGFANYVDEIQHGHIEGFAQMISKEKNDGVRVGTVVNHVL